jgi:5-methylcytosine-specific restriction endonuclease McrA
MFSELTKAQALRRSQGRCECTRLTHTHAGRCAHAVSAATAHFHHKTASFVGGGDSLSNCEVLCVNCHRLTASYGRH